jgi:hypothetical protein
MDRVNSWSALQTVPSTYLNDIQDRALGIAQMPGLLRGAAQIRSENGADILISRIRAVAFGNETVLSNASEATFTPGGLSTNTWYYIYAYNNAGAIAFEAVTTVPDADLVYKSTSSDHVYIGCFRTHTDGTTKIMPFCADKGVYYWRHSKFGVDTILVLSAGTATSDTAVNLSAGAPPHAKLVALVGNLSNSGTTTVNTSAVLRTYGDTGAQPSVQVSRLGSAGAGGVGMEESWIETALNSGNPSIYYRIINGGGATGELNLWVQGFREARS